MCLVSRRWLGHREPENRGREQGDAKLALVIPAEVGGPGCSLALALLVAASAVNIFKPNNIVFGEIGTRLHLNEKGRNLPRI